MQRSLILTCVVVMLTSCAGDAQFVLKHPVAERCASVGLRDCRDMTQAALLYAEGDPADGRRQLLMGLNENQGKTAELERFALSLEELSATSSGGEFQAPLQPAVYFIRQTVERQMLRLTLQNATSTRVAVPVSRNEKQSALLATSAESTGRNLPTLTPQHTDASTPASVFFMLAGNALAGDCHFPGAPMMRCVHEDIETSRIVSDISVPV